MTLPMLHSLADAMSAAFEEELATMSREERIVELAEAQWVGRWESQILFRDPITHSTCALPAEGLTVSAVIAKLEAKREEFGVNS